MDVRRIMREVVMNNATILAVAHNHPSNNPHPSKADDIITKNLKAACEIMRIFFMDHIIILMEVIILTMIEVNCNINRERRG